MDDLLVQLTNKENCGSATVFVPYLMPWPCDPNGDPYKIIVENNEFRVITNLQNKKDDDIPKNWYTRTDVTLVKNYTKDQVNYGVSSANILWYEQVLHDYSGCYTNACFSYDSLNGCKDVTDTVDGCKTNCYYQPKNGGGCIPECLVSCCGGGCD
jgi:hypothetical protein